MKKLIPIIVLFLAVSVLAQEKQKPVLIDEFGKISCDDFLARVDNIFIQINNHPNSKAYFVISGGKEFLVQKLQIELLLESAIPTRRYNRSLVTVVREKESGPLDTKIWLVEPGSDLADFNATKWDLHLPLVGSPFRLRSDNEQICSPSPIGKIAHELLDSNSDGKIFVVVHGLNQKERTNELRRARNMLSDFPASRIRYLRRRSNYAHSNFSDYYFALGTPKRSDFKSYF